MIQDIEPHKFYNEYEEQQASDNDYVFIFEGTKVILNNKREDVFLKFKDIKEELDENSDIVYLFSIDEMKFFLILNAENFKVFEDKFQVKTSQVFRTIQPKHMAFAGATAFHLYTWYSSNKYCGKCGSVMGHSRTERAQVCSKCGTTKYPQICPAIIVGITNGDKILMSRYAVGHGTYRKYSLIAGFNEIGETLEETVHREVMEEVGLKVKNIRYYKNQPWGLTGGLLVGFFAELDGDDQINMDEEELAEAVWFKREDIPVNESCLSLTNEMIEAFRNKC